MSADERRSSDERRSNRSGCDLDLCGDGVVRPAVLIPEPGGVEPCPLKRDGECPEGCEACVAFAEEMRIHHGGTEDTER